MCLSMDISVWKITLRFFALSLREIVAKPRLIILIGRFRLFGLNRKYSVLFGLTDNLFDIIHEKTSLTQDSLVVEADKVSSRENDK